MFFPDTLFCEIVSLVLHVRPASGCKGLFTRFMVSLCPLQIVSSLTDTLASIRRRREFSVWIILASVMVVKIQD